MSEEVNIQRYHDGRHYDREKFKSEERPCQYCGILLHKKGLGSHEARCTKNPNRKSKKTAVKKSENKISILDQLKDLDPKLIELMDAEKLKSLIIQERFNVRV